MHCSFLQDFLIYTIMNGKTFCELIFTNNWLCFTCKVTTNSYFESLVVSVVESLAAIVSSEVHLTPCNELHVSVSRTMPVRHYWIEPIVQQLKNGLSTVQRYGINQKAQSRWLPSHILMYFLHVFNLSFTKKILFIQTLSTIVWNTL